MPTHLVNCRSLVSMLRWRMHMRVSAEPMSRVAPGKEASCIGRGLAGGLCSPGLGPRGGALFHKGSPCPTPITKLGLGPQAILAFVGFWLQVPFWPVWEPSLLPNWDKDESPKEKPAKFLNGSIGTQVCADSGG